MGCPHIVSTSEFSDSIAKILTNASVVLRSSVLWCLGIDLCFLDPFILDLWRMQTPSLNSVSDPELARASGERSE